MKSLDEEIEDLFYPGSKRKIPTTRVAPKAVVEAGAWDENPLCLTINGAKVEFFTIGMLALALERTPAALRRWEANGVLPKARYRTQASDPLKQKRLYTRAQCEGIIRIAQEEGLMAVSRAGGLRRAPIPLSFVQRLTELFRGLEAKP